MNDMQDPQAYKEDPLNRASRLGCFAFIALTLVGALAVFWYDNPLTFRERPVAPPTPPVAPTAVFSAGAGRLTLAADDGGSLAVVERRGQPEIWYRVTLNNAPLGSELALDCEWVDPTGAVAKQNHYTTKKIDKPVWPTHARCQFGASSAVGTWTVKLSHQGRVLHSMTFEVKDSSVVPAEKPF